MASDPVLDFETLLAPISADNPAGEPVSFEIRQKLEDDRKEDFDRDPPQRADWRGIARISQDTLTGHSKALLVAARLTEALAHLHGFAGVRDGLRLMREMVEQCWDRLHPVIEDSDLEIRAGPFYWLDDPDKGARFPSTLRMLPLVFGDEGQYSWIDWRNAQEGKGSVSYEDFEKALQSTPPERCATLAEDIGQCLEELTKLGLALNQRMKEAAPGLTGIRHALEEIHMLARQIAQRRAPVEGESTSGLVSGDGAPAAAAAPKGAAAGVPATRAEIYRQLAQAADRLRDLEPHSPIPYLIQRAVALGSLPFPKLIQALIRDAAVLGELNREFGIKEEPPAE